MIIETCPKCGHDLMNEVICTYPPIPKKVCHNCGWSWTGDREPVVRVPFNQTNNYRECCGSCSHKRKLMSRSLTASSVDELCCVVKSDEYILRVSPWDSCEMFLRSDEERR